MKVWIKEFNVEMQIKQKGIELDVWDASGKTRRGDLYVTMTELIWCPGKTTREKGKRIKWDEFISLMESRD